MLHIELRRWADILVIAPLDANTLAKMAGGLCDNLLVSCIIFISMTCSEYVELKVVINVSLR